MNEATPHPPVPVSSISALPVEILDQIIAEVVTQKRSAITPLMCVSQFWHDAIMQQPLLWAKVELDLSRSEHSFLPSYKMARRCIDRSAAIDLDITIRIRSSRESCACARVFDDCASCSEWTSANRTVLEILSGEQGEHLARWKSLAVLNNGESSIYHGKWVVEVISPIIDLGGTPRLRVLLLADQFRGQITFHHTPLLEVLSLPDARDILITNVDHVRKLAFRDALPVHLSAGLFTSLTHLILHMPIHCSNLELPNVRILDLIDSMGEVLELELPILPRVQRISVATRAMDFLPHLKINHYSTWKSFCLRYNPDRPCLVPSDQFIEDAVAFITSNCSHLEELDIELCFLAMVKANVRHFPNLKRILIMGANPERESWRRLGVPDGDPFIE
jgi:hypothetical protein